MAYGWSPEEMHFQHPDLTLGQIYSALAYKKRLKRYDRLRKIFGIPPVVTRLKIKK